MHQISADEFRIIKGNVPLGSPGFLPLAEKVTFSCVTERILLLEMAILWV